MNFMRSAITHALSGAVLGLAVLALGSSIGCAAKKPLAPIHGQVEVRYRPDNCRPLDGAYPPGSQLCDKVKLIPMTVQVAK